MLSVSVCVCAHMRIHIHTVCAYMCARVCVCVRICVCIAHNFIQVQSLLRLQVQRFLLWESKHLPMFSLGAKWNRERKRERERESMLRIVTIKPHPPHEQWYEEVHNQTTQRLHWVPCHKRVGVMEGVLLAPLPMSTHEVYSSYRRLKNHCESIKHKAHILLPPGSLCQFMHALLPHWNHIIIACAINV